MSPSTPEARPRNSDEGPEKKEDAPWMHFLWVETKIGKKLNAERASRQNHQMKLLKDVAIRVAQDKGIELDQEEAVKERERKIGLRKTRFSAPEVSSEVAQDVTVLTAEIVRQIKGLEDVALSSDDADYINYWLGNSSAYPNLLESHDFKSVTRKIELLGLLEDTISTVFAQLSAISESRALVTELANVVIDTKAREYGKNVDVVVSNTDAGIHIKDSRFRAVYNQDMGGIIDRLVQEGKVDSAEATDLRQLVGVTVGGKHVKPSESRYENLDRQLEILGLLAESLNARVAQETLTPKEEKRLKETQAREDGLAKHLAEIEKRKLEADLHRTQAQTSYARAEEAIAAEAATMTLKQPGTEEAVARRTLNAGVSGAGMPGNESRQTAVMEALESDREFQTLKETMQRIRGLFPGLAPEDIKRELIKTGLISATSTNWVQAVALLATFNENDQALSADLKIARGSLDALGGMSPSDVKSIIQAAQSLAEKVEKVKAFVGHPVDPDKLDYLIGPKMCAQKGYDGEQYIRALAGDYDQDFLSLFVGKGKATAKNHIADIRKFRDAMEREFNSYLDKVKSPTLAGGHSERQAAAPESDPREVSDWLSEAKNLGDLFKLCKDPRNLELIKQSTGLDITKKSDFLKFIDMHFLQNPMRAPNMIVFDDEGNRFPLGELIEAGQVDGSEFPLNELLWLLLSSSSLESATDRLSQEKKILGYRDNVRRSIDSELGTFKADAIVDHLFARLKVVLELKRLFAEEGLQPGFTYSDLKGLIERMKTTLGEQRSPGFIALMLLFAGLPTEELTADREGLPGDKKNISALWELRSPVAFGNFLTTMSEDTREFEGLLKDIERYRQLKAETSSGSSTDYLEAV